MENGKIEGVEQTDEADKENKDEKSTGNGGIETAMQTDQVITDENPHTILREKDKKIKELEEQLLAAQNKIQIEINEVVVPKVVKEKDEQIQVVQKQLEKLEKEKLDHSKLETEVQALRSKSDETKSKSEETKLLLETEKEKHNIAKAEIKKQQIKWENGAKSRKQLQTAVEKEKGVNKGLEKEVQTLKEELQKAHAQNSQKAAEIIKTNRSLESATEKMSSLDEQNEKQTAALNKCKEEVANLKETIQFGNRQMLQLRKDNKQYSHEMQICKNRAVKAEKAILQLMMNFRKVQLDSQVQDINTTIADVESKLPVLQSKGLNEVVSALQTYCSEYRQCKKSINDSYEQIVTFGGHYQMMIENGEELTKLAPLPPLTNPDPPQFPEHVLQMTASVRRQPQAAVNPYQQLQQPVETYTAPCAAAAAQDKATIMTHLKAYLTQYANQNHLYADEAAINGCARLFATMKISMKISDEKMHTQVVDMYKQKLKEQGRDTQTTPNAPPPSQIQPQHYPGPAQAPHVNPAGGFAQMYQRSHLATGFGQPVSSQGFGHPTGYQPLASRSALSASQEHTSQLSQHSSVQPTAHSSPLQSPPPPPTPPPSKPPPVIDQRHMLSMDGASGNVMSYGTAQSLLFSPITNGPPLPRHLVPPIQSMASVPPTMNDALPVSPELVKSAAVGPTEECAICLEKIHTHSEAYRCPTCKMYFYHCHCLEAFLSDVRTNGKCPTCQQRMISGRQFPPLK